MVAHYLASKIPVNMSNRDEVGRGLTCLLTVVSEPESKVVSQDRREAMVLWSSQFPFNYYRIRNGQHHVGLGSWCSGGPQGPGPDARQQ